MEENTMGIYAEWLQDGKTYRCMVNFVAPDQVQDLVEKLNNQNFEKRLLNLQHIKITYKIRDMMTIGLVLVDKKVMLRSYSTDELIQRKEYLVEKYKKYGINLKVSIKITDEADIFYNIPDFVYNDAARGVVDVDAIERELTIIHLNELIMEFARI